MTGSFTGIMAKKINTKLLGIGQKILFYFLIVTILSSCGEKDEPGGHTLYKIDENLYPMLFDTGSYWIYKNVEDNVIDSIALIAFEIDTTEIRSTGSGYTASNQVYLLTYSSQVSGTFTEQYLGYVIQKGPDYSNYDYGNYVYLSSFLIGEVSSNARIAAFYYLLEVNDVTYKNVVVMDITNDTYIENDMNLYYTDSIGVIIKEIKIDSEIAETWVLEEYHTNLYEIE